jgi:hypothetical protein
MAKKPAKCIPVKIPAENKDAFILKFSLSLRAQDQEDLRWYLEDYLQYPLDPAPSIARRIERRMEEIGLNKFVPWSFYILGWQDQP